MLKAVQANPSLAAPVIDRSEVGVFNVVEGHRATRGQSRPQRGFALVAECIQEAEDDFIKAAVPMEELGAALEDESFSEETVTTEGSESDPGPNPIEACGAKTWWRRGWSTTSERWSHTRSTLQVTRSL